MQKYGIQRQHQHGYPDNHPQKGLKNWWELDYHNGKSKKRARRIAKIEITQEINDNVSEM
jgi:hypothetical protein